MKLDVFRECFEGECDVESVVAGEFDRDVFDAVVGECFNEEVGCYF